MQIDPLSDSRIAEHGFRLERRRLVQLLWVILASLSLVLALSVADGAWTSAACEGAAAAVMLLALWLASVGRVPLAAHLMLLTLTVLTSAMIFRSQGLRDEAVCAIPALMVFSAMFGSRKVFLAVLVTLFAMLATIAAANIRGWHANPVGPVTWGSLANLLVVLSATAFFVWLMASDLRLALSRLEVENGRIRESFTRIDLLAHHDALTGLPNRLLARDRFAQALALAQRQHTPVALLFLDLDNFKDVNDSLGHAAGDLLLREVARRLQRAVRACDTVSRHGGDEFLVIMGDLGEQTAIAATAVKIMEQLAVPFQVLGMELSATCSLGISVYPQDGAEFDTLLKHADMAMYHAKDAGRNTFSFYDVEINTSVIDHLHLISGIRAALARQQFKLHYQPQFDLRSGLVVGAEALIRWRHPELGMIPPAKFIAVAERSGLINEIGTWVLNEACRQAKAWQNAGLLDLVVAVNLSPVQFRRGDIERDILQALAQAELAPTSIELELTESLLIAEAGHLGPLLSRLRQRGIRLSIDDFGTGYSNLGYLRRFEVERLKIDQSFVRRMTVDGHDEGIVRAIIQMAHSLKLEAVAEGVEDAATLARLIELGCEFGQGYHWSPAVPPDEFFEFVQARQGLDRAGHRRSA
ncbi:MAG: EAL domain-containing protein [Pseudomonadota bacterium]